MAIRGIVCTAAAGRRVLGRAQGAQPLGEPCDRPRLLEKSTSSGASLNWRGVEYVSLDLRGVEYGLGLPDRVLIVLGVGDSLDWRGVEYRLPSPLMRPKPAAARPGRAGLWGFAPRPRPAGWQEQYLGAAPCPRPVGVASSRRGAAPTQLSGQLSCDALEVRRNRMLLKL